MTIRFAQKHMEELPLGNLTAGQFLSVATETSKQMGWVFGDISSTGFIAYTNNGVFSWNAEIKLKIKKEVAYLQSRSRGDDIVDVRENKKNLQNFIAAFKILRKQETSEQHTPKHPKPKANSI